MSQFVRSVSPNEDKGLKHITPIQLELIFTAAKCNTAR